MALIATVTVNEHRCLATGSLASLVLARQFLTPAPHIIMTQQLIYKWHLAYSTADVQTTAVPDNQEYITHITLPCILLSEAILHFL
jgi:hypothetical protein